MTPLPQVGQAEPIEAERLAFLARASPEDMLKELLAVIHGDGGHYSDEHGLAKAVADAEIKYLASSHAAPAAGANQLDITLTEQELSGIRLFGSSADDDDIDLDADAVRLLIGPGHEGYGLYASSPAYPEEGSVCIKELAQPVAQQSAAPLEDLGAHHLTPESILARLAQLRRFADPEQSAQAEWDNLDWRGFCNTTALIVESLFAQVSAAIAPLAERQPLTEDAIWALRGAARADPRCEDQHWFVLFARLVEGHHGIAPPAGGGVTQGRQMP